MFMGQGHCAKDFVAYPGPSREMPGPTEKAYSMGLNSSANAYSFNEEQINHNYYRLIGVQQFSSTQQLKVSKVSKVNVLTFYFQQER